MLEHTPTLSDETAYPDNNLTILSHYWRYEVAINATPNLLSNRAGGARCCTSGAAWWRVNSPFSTADLRPRSPAVSTTTCCPDSVHLPPRIGADQLSVAVGGTAHHGRFARMCEQDSSAMSCSGRSGVCSFHVASCLTKLSLHNISTHSWGGFH